MKTSITKSTNVMAFAHFQVKRMIRMGSKQPYAKMLARELSSAHYKFQRHGVEYMTAELVAYKAVEKRCEAEKSVVRLVVSTALKAGLKVSVHDGECWPVRQSSDKAAIMAEIQTTDSNVLRIRTTEGESVGFVSFVYGNSASEVMADWTDTDAMNTLLAPAIKRCDRLANLGK